MSSSLRFLLVPVSHAIVTSLGGTLRAESQPGMGTRFIVTLPAA